MAKDQDYEAAVAKGTKLLQLMLASDPKGSLQSAFKDVEQMVENGYNEGEEDTFEISCISAPLLELGASDKMIKDGGQNIRTCRTHDEDRVINGVSYDKTNAQFAQVCNPTSGILIADSNMCPGKAGPLMDIAPVYISPPLQHWSEVAFLQYLSTFAFPPPQPLPLKAVFRVQIQNVETYTLLQKVIEKHGHDTYLEWPGVSFEAESEEGRAILGTPNGSGVAWMLVQHKKQFGGKSVERVNLFYAPKKSDLYRWPSLLFWIRQDRMVRGVVHE